MKHHILSSLAIGLLAGAAFSVAPAAAHTALCSCYDNKDGTILCEGGFSDGASAAGVRMLVSGKDGKVLAEGAMNKNSEFTFNKPGEDFFVRFDAGEGHQINIKGSDIH
ncbi:hypothetical protein [Blastochloris sulfoviridis]|uniref:Lysozyme inhibitor n=1 Tax=Blastochloris sulfoviridis TaxID=50712 RepID=A0A5M6I2Z5_9HYPH|nr:hypothetical protein [Blastochloris sulfoviridis]KAA5602168.1 hypothetical protein F1193_07330 [Blastochloris sulfoviridis]NJL08530.1 hypothetical protein [Candidatus Methylacidiphilales bacterium]